MLAILADLGRGNPKRTIENIVNQVVATSKGNFSKLRHVQQLRILGQLRNLALDNLEIMDSVANYMSEEKDILYRRGEKKGMEKGIEKGIEKGKEAIVKNLLLNTDFTIAKIASLSDVTEAFVKKVKKTLK
jgi:predicted transposase/invertase (TIGR01784 family)